MRLWVSAWVWVLSAVSFGGLAGMGCGGVEPAAASGARRATTSDVRASQLHLPGLPPLAKSALTAAERALVDEAMRLAREPLGLREEMSLEAYAAYAQESVQPWATSRRSLLERLVAEAPPDVRAEVASAIALSLAWSLQQQLLAIPLPSAIAGDEELGAIFHDALRELAVGLVRIALRGADRCTSASAVPWTGEACRSLAARLATDAGADTPPRAAAVSVPEPQHGVITTRAGVYFNDYTSPAPRAVAWPSVCDGAAESRASSVPTATVFAVSSPSELAAQLPDAQREELRLAIATRLATLTGWQSLPAEDVRRAAQARAESLDAGACTLSSSERPELVRGRGPIYLVRPRVQCGGRAPGTCSLSVDLSALDADGRTVAARLPTFPSQPVGAPSTWVAAAQLLEMRPAEAPMGVGVWSRSAAPGVSVYAYGPTIGDDVLAAALVRIAAEVAAVIRSTSFVQRVELALSFAAADGSLSTCAAADDAIAPGLARQICRVLRGVRLGDVGSPQLVSVGFVVGPEPDEPGQAIELWSPGLYSVASSARARSTLARCFAGRAPPVTALRVALDSPTPATRLEGTVVSSDIARCIANAVRDWPLPCVNPPSAVTVCVRRLE